jgi:hypothetical protein
VVANVPSSGRPRVTAHTCGLGARALPAKWRLFQVPLSRSPAVPVPPVRAASLSLCLIWVRPSVCRRRVGGHSETEARWSSSGEGSVPCLTAGGGGGRSESWRGRRVLSISGDGPAFVSLLAARAPARCPRRVLAHRRCS